MLVLTVGAVFADTVSVAALEIAGRKPFDDCDFCWKSA